ncbi:autotransporter domain-containing protein [Endozoicomonas sp. Mp262]|uniref:autotransporter domain-containing protein n=1 Tax=Endozoicomonas sp. Mp262 TaxID=2919499 RepID=UPI0021D9411E
MKTVKRKATILPKLLFISILSLLTITENVWSEEGWSPKNNPVLNGASKAVNAGCRGAFGWSLGNNVAFSWLCRNIITETDIDKLRTLSLDELLKEVGDRDLGKKISDLDNTELQNLFNELGDDRLFHLLTISEKEINDILAQIDKAAEKEIELERAAKENPNINTQQNTITKDLERKTRKILGKGSKYFNLVKYHHNSKTSKNTDTLDSKQLQYSFLKNMVMHIDLKMKNSIMSRAYCLKNPKQCKNYPNSGNTENQSLINRIFNYFLDALKSLYKTMEYNYMAPENLHKDDDSFMFDDSGELLTIKPPSTTSSVFDRQVQTSTIDQNQLTTDQKMALDTQLTNKSIDKLQEEVNKIQAVIKAFNDRLTGTNSHLSNHDQAWKIIEQSNNQLPEDQRTHLDSTPLSKARATQKSLTEDSKEISTHLQALYGNKLHELKGTDHTQVDTLLQQLQKDPRLNLESLQQKLTAHETAVSAQEGAIRHWLDESNQPIATIIDNQNRQALAEQQRRENRITRDIKNKERSRYHRQLITEQQRVAEQNRLAEEQRKAKAEQALIEQQQAHTSINTLQIEVDKLGDIMAAFNKRLTDTRSSLLNHNQAWQIIEQGNSQLPKDQRTDLDKTPLSEAWNRQNVLAKDIEGITTHLKTHYSSKLSGLKGTDHSNITRKANDLLQSLQKDSRFNLESLQQKLSAHETAVASENGIITNFLNDNNDVIHIIETLEQYNKKASQYEISDIASIYSEAREFFNNAQKNTRTNYIKTTENIKDLEKINEEALEGYNKLKNEHQELQKTLTASSKTSSEMHQCDGWIPCIISSNKTLSSSEIQQLKKQIMDDDSRLDTILESATLQEPATSKKIEDLNDLKESLTQQLKTLKDEKREADSKKGTRLSPLFSLFKKTKELTDNIDNKALTTSIKDKINNLSKKSSDLKESIEKMDKVNSFNREWKTLISTTEKLIDEINIHIKNTKEINKNFKSLITTAQEQKSKQAELITTVDKDLEQQTLKELQQTIAQTQELINQKVIQVNGDLDGFNQRLVTTENELSTHDSAWKTIEHNNNKLAENQRITLDNTLLSKARERQKTLTKDIEGVTTHLKTHYNLDFSNIKDQTPEDIARQAEALWTTMQNDPQLNLEQLDQDITAHGNQVTDPKGDIHSLLSQSIQTVTTAINTVEEQRKALELAQQLEEQRQRNAWKKRQKTQKEVQKEILDIHQAGERNRQLKKQALIDEQQRIAEQNRLAEEQRKALELAQQLEEQRQQDAWEKRQKTQKEVQKEILDIHQAGERNRQLKKQALIDEQQRIAEQNRLAEEQRKALELAQQLEEQRQQDAWEKRQKTQKEVQKEILDIHQAGERNRQLKKQALIDEQQRIAEQNRLAEEQRKALELAQQLEEQRQQDAWEKRQKTQKEVQKEILDIHQAGERNRQLKKQALIDEQQRIAEQNRLAEEQRKALELAQQLEEQRQQDAWEKRQKTQKEVQKEILDIHQAGERNRQLKKQALIDEQQRIAEQNRLAEEQRKALELAQQLEEQRQQDAWEKRQKTQKEVQKEILDIHQAGERNRQLKKQALIDEQQRIAEQNRLAEEQRKALELAQQLEEQRQQDAWEKRQKTQKEVQKEILDIHQAGERNRQLKKQALIDEQQRIAEQNRLAEEKRKALELKEQHQKEAWEAGQNLLNLSKKATSIMDREYLKKSVKEYFKKKAEKNHPARCSDDNKAACQDAYTKDRKERAQLLAQLNGKSVDDINVIVPPEPPKPMDDTHQEDKRKRQQQEQRQKEAWEAGQNLLNLSKKATSIMDREYLKKSVKEYFKKKAEKNHPARCSDDNKAACQDAYTKDRKERAQLLAQLNGKSVDDINVIVPPEPGYQGTTALVRHKDWLVDHGVTPKPEYKGTTALVPYKNVFVDNGTTPIPPQPQFNRADFDLSKYDLSVFNKEQFQWLISTDKNTVRWVWRQVASKIHPNQTSGGNTALAMHYGEFFKELQMCFKGSNPGQCAADLVSDRDADQTEAVDRYKSHIAEAKAKLERPDKDFMEQFGAISLTQSKLLQGTLDLGPLAALHIIQGKSYLPRLASKSLSLDNLSTEELMASRSITSHDPAFNKGPGNWHTFIQVNGTKGSWRQQQNLPGQSFTGYGLTVGLFRELDEHWMAGIMLGNRTTNISMERSSAKTKIDSIIFGPFASWSKDNWHIDGALTIIQNNYAIERQDALGNKLKDDVSGMDWSTYLGVGYDIHLDDTVPGLTLTPTFSVLYYNSEIKGLKEKGNSPQAIKNRSRKRYQVTTRAGAELTYLLPDLEKPTEINVSLGLQRQVMNEHSGTYDYYQSSAEHASNNPYTTPRVHDNGVYYGLGITRLLSDTSNFKLDFSGNLSQRSRSNSLQLTYEKKF